MTITKHPFGTLSDGTAVWAWRLEENGLIAEVLDYGVTIRKILVLGKDGLVNVVLGYDTIEDYVNHSAYYGATVGRFANRIAGAQFELNGETYHLAANNGPNHIHGGPGGFSRRVFDAREEEDGVVFTYLSPDGEEGYPGNLEVAVKVSWQENRLTLHYTAKSDKDTILNLTNHSYFNLDGGGTVSQQVLQIDAEHYTPVGEGLIPTGELESVAGTFLDFRTPKPIADGGYDHNFVLRGGARAVSHKSGITLEMDTTEPGVQLYTPGSLSAFCLETQHFPDCIHHPQWPSCILKAGELFESETGYTFTAVD